ncbi:FAD-dependent monooxygenase [Candidatus Bipolaricaulota bacterium]|nr:FAD-dependent monooxygenase [Candidatus Bipolaricaulota bacterium]
MKKVDVAILGAGPAGLFAAQELAQSGLTTILVDRGGNRRSESISALVSAGPGPSPMGNSTSPQK